MSLCLAAALFLATAAVRLPLPLSLSVTRPCCAVTCLVKAAQPAVEYKSFSSLGSFSDMRARDLKKVQCVHMVW